MIKKSFGIAIIFCIAYALLLSTKPDLSITQHQWQGNIIKAQKFLYSNNDQIENVIVGTSLAARINTDSLPNTFNLAFAGLSIYDGLHILVNMEHPPKNVYIESNYVVGDENEEFATVYSPAWLCYIKKQVPALRDGKQPLGVMGFMMASYATAPVISKFKPAKPQITNSTPNEDKKTVFAKMLNLQKLEYSKTPDAVTLDKHFKVLKDYIAQLERRGVTIIFFEMPVDSSLEHLSRASTYRNGFYQHFPASKYRYIPLPADSYETGDGIHLPEKEALRYTLWLGDQVRISAKPTAPAI